MAEDPDIPVVVVVADDDPMARELVHLAVDGTAVDVVDVDHGDAVAAACAGADLLLLDLHMPGPPVAEVVARVREVAEGIPVVLVSGAATDELDAVRAGLDVADALAKGDVTGLRGWVARVAGSR